MGVEEKAIGDHVRPADVVLPMSAGGVPSPSNHKVMASPADETERPHFALFGASSSFSNTNPTPLKHRTDLSRDSQDSAAPALRPRMKPPPGYADYSRFERRVNLGRAVRLEDAAADPKAYIVIGIFDGAHGWPRERVIQIKHPSLLFWQMWWEILQLRGVSYLLSLKDVAGFKLYKYHWNTAVDEHLMLSAEDAAILGVFRKAYGSWSPSAAEGWSDWIQNSLNFRELRGGRCPPSKALGFEIVLGWSPARISVVILGPVLLSLVIGIWFQSRDPTDLTTIQTAWSISSYIATAGGLVAALLAILSGIKE